MASENLKNVKINNGYWDISADIHFPPNFDEKKKYPAIISAHPIGSCKEQTSGNVYGEGLAKEGFVVIAFDASFQGDSGGEPRSIEDPVLRVEDFYQVTDYLMTLPYVDEDRIGVLGICGGGGYFHQCRDDGAAHQGGRNRHRSQLWTPHARGLQRIRSYRRA